MTYGVVDSKVSILVGGRDCDSLQFPETYQGFNVHAHHNIVELTGFDEAYCEKLRAGCELQVRNKSLSHTFGTLGGFVKVEDKLFGMTCCHVIPNNTAFTQPADKSLGMLFSQKRFEDVTSGTRALKEVEKEVVKGDIDYERELNRDFGAGVSKEFGICTIKDQQWLDYQLLEIDPSRQPSQPCNRITLNKQIVPIKTSKLNLEFINRETRFGKIGAMTNFSTGNLVNRKRKDCYVKIKGSQVHTFEFAFKNSIWFTQRGDSGSWLFAMDRRPYKAVGMVFAASVSRPFLTFATPFSSIVADFRSRTGKELKFVN